MTGIAAGMALEGYRVFTYSIANFCTLRCLEQVRNDICYHEAPVTIVSIGGGFGYGSLGMSHHATEDLSIMRALPNLDVLVPGDDYEAKEATKAICENKRPTYLRLERGALNHDSQGILPYEFGKARELASGSDLTILCSGGVTQVAIEAEKIMSRKGINLRVASLHTLKPIDEEYILDCAKNTGGIVTLEENNLIGGLGSAVCEVLMDSQVHPKTFSRLGLNDVYSSIVGTQEYLREQYNLDSSALVKVIKELIQ